MLHSLTLFYQKNTAHRERLYEVILGLSPLSLRVIDWFITHFAKTRTVIYWINDSTNEYTEQSPSNTNFRKFNLYLDYRAQLKSYTKLYFDPFRRHERISFVLEKDPIKVVESTIGQLNFFRWALQNHVLDYIQNHLTEIEEHMSAFQKKNKDIPSPSNTVTKAPCYLRFD
jgi:hypothetical protein